jgi:hypothetical protein
MIADTGKSIVAFRRNEEQDLPSTKRFGFVQSYDTKPRRRLWELMKSQGMQENQHVLFLSDGATGYETYRSIFTPPANTGSIGSMSPCG